MTSIVDGETQDGIQAYRLQQIGQRPMVVRIECYVGEPGGHEWVKLEQPIWPGADGPVVLSDYPVELDYL